MNSMGKCFLVLLLTTIGPSSCVPTEDCDCAVSGFAVFADQTEVRSVTASGVACNGAKIECYGSDRTNRPGCSAYFILPNREGQCTIDVVLESGEARTRTVDFTYSPGCCQGYYVEDGPNDLNVDDPETL